MTTTKTTTKEHEEDYEKMTPPMQHSYETVVLFADVSGYTAMCEAMSNTGPGGEQHLAKNLNSYFELMVRAQSSDWAAAAECLPGRKKKPEE